MFRTFRSLRPLTIASVSTLLASCGSTLITSGARDQAATPEAFAPQLTRLLSATVDSEGSVDYPQLVKKSDELSALFAHIEERSPDSHPALFPSEESALAYWINAYNVATLQAVVANHPIESVRDVKPASPLSLFAGGGFFAAQKFRFGGKKMSLYTLENQIIRKRFSDPRIHFAINCASESCPSLLNRAYTSEQLESQLQRQTTAFMRSPKALVVDHQQREIQISALFDWYAQDFLADLERRGATAPDVLDYLLPFLPADRRTEVQKARDSGYSRKFLPYDWSLNTAR